MEMPVVVGLHVCERVTADPVTGALSLSNRITRLSSEHFPTLGFDLSVIAFLTDGFGMLAFRIEIESLATGELIHEFPTMEPFADRLREVNFQLRLPNVAFPHPGGYQIGLMIEDEPIARCRISLLEPPGESA